MLRPPFGTPREPAGCVIKVGVARRSPRALPMLRECASARRLKRAGDLVFLIGRDEMGQWTVRTRGFRARGAVMLERRRPHPKRCCAACARGRGDLPAGPGGARYVVRCQDARSLDREHSGDVAATPRADAAPLASPSCSASKLAPHRGNGKGHLRLVLYQDDTDLGFLAPRRGQRLRDDLPGARLLGP